MTVPAADADLATLDLTDLRVWRDGPPHELFARMRDQAPVRWNPSADGYGFWSLTRGRDIERVSNDPATFSSSAGGIFLRPDTLGPLEFVRQLAISMDPPQHTRFRDIVALLLRARTLAFMEDIIDGCVAETLERAAANGSCDLVRDVAEPIPLRVIGRMLGAAENDMDTLLRWTTEIERGIADSGDVVDTVKQMTEYLRGLVGGHITSQVDTLAQLLLDAEIEGGPLNEQELGLYFGLLLYAGNGPTRNAVSAGILALLEHPDQLRLLRDGPQLMQSTRSGRPTTALQEILRWTTPVNYLARTATTDVDLHGVTVRAGDRVVMWYASASRDPEYVPGGDVFDVGRNLDANGHFAFGGGGPHHCQGGFLAVKMISAIIPAVLARMPDLALDGPPVRADTMFANQVSSMPVTFSRR